MREAKPKIVILGPLPPAIGGISTYMQNILASPLCDRYDLIPVQTMSRKHGSAAYERNTLFKRA